MDQHQLRITILQALYSPGSTMGGTVVDNPEHAACVVVRGARHHLLDQTIKGRDPVFSLATTKDPGVMHVQCGHVGPGSAAKIFVFDAHSGAGATSARGMLAPSRLNAGFLIGRNDELIVFQGFSLPLPSIEV